MRLRGGLAQRRSTPSGGRGGTDEREKEAGRSGPTLQESTTTREKFSFLLYMFIDIHFYIYMCVSM